MTVPGPFTVRRTALEGVVVIESRVFADERGLFYEAWRENAFKEIDPGLRFVQDNHSHSAPRVLRGMHWQDARAPLGKLVRCSRGAVFDVAVDLRLGSPTFGKWAGEELTGENGRQMYIPPGFAHGFVAMGEGADVQYKVTGYWMREAEGCLAWNDPEVGIAWPVKEPVVNARDAAGMSLAEYRANPSFRSDGKGGAR